MPVDDDAGPHTVDDEFEPSPGATRAPGFLIPPGYPQVINIDFNTLLNHGHVTPEVLEHLTGLLAALQDSFRTAVPRRSVPPGYTPTPASSQYDNPDCPDLGSSCPEVQTICPADCPSDTCNTHCSDHVPTCIDWIECPDRFSGCPPRCLDHDTCFTFEDRPPPQCGTKIEETLPPPGGECTKVDER
jgi:hypothetical protein